MNTKSKKMSGGANLDMTKGRPAALIIRFIIPVVLGNIFQQLYGMVDTIIVGRCVGDKALAAVGATGTIMFFIIGFATGLTSGFTVITGQRFGAGDYRGVRKSVASAFLLSAAVALVMTILSVASMNQILRIMRTPDDIFTMSRDYIVIICLGLGCTILYNLIAGILRSIGNSRVPLYFLIFSATLNVALDLLFVMVLQWGVAGAAWATILAQGIAGVLSLVYMLRKVDFMKLTREDFAPDGSLMSLQMRIGFPMALQFAITAIGTMILQAALNMLGSTVIAAYTAAMKIESLVATCYQAMGVTMASYSAQNWGVHDLDRIRKGQFDANLISGTFSVIMLFVVMAVCRPLAQLFFSGDITQVLGYIREYLLYGCVCYIPLGMIFIYRNVLQGMGMTFWPTMAGVVELVARTVFAFYAARKASYTGVCIANASAWLTAGIFLWIAYLRIVPPLASGKKAKKEAYE